MFQKFFFILLLHRSPSLAIGLSALKLNLDPKSIGKTILGIFRKNTASFWIWTVVSFLFFLVVLYTRSRSGLAGLAAAEAVFWLILFLRTSDRKALLVPFAVVNLVFAAILFINGSPIDSLNKYFSLAGWQSGLTKSKTASAPSPAPSATGTTLLEYGGTESTTIRKYVWEAAVTAWNSSTKTRLIGTGTETFAFAFYRFKPAAHNLTSEWDFLYNKAHNEYLNYLATTGIFGLGTYLLFIGAFVIWFIKFSIFNFQFSNKDNGKRELFLLNAALFAGWLSILITNFFGFSVVVIQHFLFLFPAFVFTANRTDEPAAREINLPQKSLFANSAYAVSLAAALYLLFTIGKFWYADSLYATGYRDNRGGQYAQAKAYLEQAINLNSNEPVYHDELGSALSGLAVSLIDAGQATPAAELMKQSLAQSDKALSISPGNVNFWKTRTKIFYSFSAYVPEMNTAAIEALKQALTLSPEDPKIYYNLAILYGRENDNTTAVTDLKKSIILKPNYRDAYYALYVFYNETGKPDLAKTTLEEYLTKVDPNDKDFRQRLGK